MLWSVLALYGVLFVSLKIPSVQRFVAQMTQSVLEDKLKTKVRIDNIAIGIPNRIIIDGLMAEDRQHRPMLDSKRLSAKIDIIPLFTGEISISAIQIFGLDAHLSKANADAPLNCQFVIDAFKSKEKKEKSPLNLHIASVVLRNSAVSYDRLDKPMRPGVFDVNHLSVSKISGHIMMPLLTDDKLLLKVKRLSLTENSSGLELRKMHLDLVADKKQVKVRTLAIETAGSDVSLVATVLLDGKHVRMFNVKPFSAHVSTKDVALFVPQLRKFDEMLAITADAIGNETSVKVNNVRISSQDRTLQLALNAQLRRSPDISVKATDVRLHIASEFADRVVAALTTSNIRQTIDALQYIDYRGDIIYAASDFSVKGLLHSGVGDIKHDVTFHNNLLVADLQTPVLHLGALKMNGHIGDIKADITLRARIEGGLKNISGGIKYLRNASVNADIPLLTFNSYPLSNIRVDVTDVNNAVRAQMSVNDPNLCTEVAAKISDISSLVSKSSRACSLYGSADVVHLNPDNIGLNTRWNNTDFTFKTVFDIENIRNLLKKTYVSVSNFIMRSPTEVNSFGDITVKSEQSAALGTRAEIHSDFCEADVNGYFDVKTLAQSFTNIITSKMPTLPGLPGYHATCNNVNFDILVSDATVLQKILGVNLVCDDPIKANGFVNDKTCEADITIDAPQFCFKDKRYKCTSLRLVSDRDSMSLKAQTGMVNAKGGIFSLNLDANASGNTMSTSVSFNNGMSRVLAGKVNMNASFSRDADGKTMIFADIKPSLITTGDTTWHVRPAQISYSANRLTVSNFAIEHNKQHVIINGVASKNLQDSLVADIRDVNIRYILDFVNFHSVDFDGLASGRAVVRSLFSTPDAKARLQVKDFLFESGRMGTLYADASWNNEDGQIDIDAHCQGNPYTLEDKATTYIRGFISPKNNYMSLGIKAVETPSEFMAGFCSFMHDVNVTAAGDFWIGGSLKALDMKGDLHLNGDVGFQSLGTTYYLRNTHAIFEPGVISVDGDTLFDGNNQIAVVKGKLRHTNLSRWNYDVDIDAHHFECFNFPTLSTGQTFGGYAVGSGKCKIKGRPGEIVFDVDAYPEKGSYITYDVSSPDALQNQEFITWGTARNDSLDILDGGALAVGAYNNSESDAGDIKLRSNISMNLLVHATKESSLRFIMDSKAGDLITLYGSGVIRANWHNKSGMKVFGNYMVDHGKYHMTMKQIVEKDFEFLPEGGLTFNGNPMESVINLHARYTINGVPLSDLNIGKSFSNNTTRVNCLMNVTGTAAAPKVGFALELPQASSDIQQMITSLIDSEDEMNQQVVYLLAIGRFYNNIQLNQSSSTTSQTSLAMQSFLSGTVSQKFNSAVSGIIKNNNWNFGANVSPGDEGMNNAEYEGTISGRLLNNRLLLNGQFGYRDNRNATTSFIGDFDLRYLLVPSGNISVHVYNKTSDRYFTRNTLNTQGIGIILKRDFTHFSDLFWWKKKK